MQLAWFGGFLGAALSFASPVLAGSLETDVRGLIAKQGFAVDDVAVAIISDRGELAVSIHSRKPLKPASNQKVLTSAAAMHLLGPDHRYETTLVAAAPIRDGRIDGDLTVRGTGDPNMSSRFYDGGPAALFRQWARELSAKGLRRIRGDLVADDTFFDDVRLPPTWDMRQEETWYSAQVSALSINDNCLDVLVRPAAQAGRPARVEVVPSCGAIQVEGAPETVAGAETRVIVHRKPGTNRVSVTGQIALRHPPWSGNVTLDDPAMVFASTLAEVLKGEGIAIQGKVRKAERGNEHDASIVRAAQGGAGTGAVQRSNEPSRAVPSSARAVEVALVKHTSTLLQDLPIILKRSQNLHAEVLLKALGARAGGEGSLKGGERAIRKFLKAKGISDAGLVLGDGSGLSHENRVTAEILARVLYSVRAEKYFDDYLKALPLAGLDGTLDDRFRASPVRGNLYAKTGYIKGVSCLSGYVVKGERVWCFSVLVNRLRGGVRGAKALQERIGERVYEEM